MKKETYLDLLSRGFDEEWLRAVMENFVPKETGKYEILITDIENLDDDPRDGIFVERAFFDNDKDLSVIHYFFEGMGYVITEVATGNEVDSGTLNDGTFELVADHEGLDYDAWGVYECDAKGNIVEDDEDDESELSGVERALAYCDKLLELYDKNIEISDLEICHIIEILKGRE